MIMADHSNHKVSMREISQLEKSNTKLKTCIIGSGNWGSTIARIIGENVQKFSYFDLEVKMYVYEEMIGTEKLTDIINTKHENVKYLPGFKIPSNVIAVPDVLETARDADILVFVIPHQFVVRTCQTLKNKLKPGACGISLIKGFDLVPGAGQVKLISSVIEEMLDMNVSVLMGANLANEVAAEKFCETTIGCKDPNMGKLLKNLIETPNFRVVVTDDVATVEVCGALKNIVACGAGFIDGLQNGDNTKAAIIRLGLMEMIKFCEEFYPGCKLDTFFQSCGVADLVTTCYGGRNRKVSEAFVLTGKSIAELEKEMLNGQKLQGPETAAEVYAMLKKNNLDGKFPLFVAIHRICVQEIQPSEIIECIRQHPVHLME